MKIKTEEQFLAYFPDHAFRYLDQTGEGRPPISSGDIIPELNAKKYESYFTVNGFRSAPNAQKENCSSINAFFVDIDGRKDMDELTDIRKKLDPTFIIETGRGHHLYWVLETPIYREGLPAGEWNKVVAQWEKIEQGIVSTLKGDPVVKDLTRILRVPYTTYWKKTKGEFKIKIIHQDSKNVYKMEAVEKAFPVADLVPASVFPTETRATKASEAQRSIFFEQVNAEFPIEERDSFQKLISASPDSLPAPNMRNNALLITATLARQAGWDKKKMLKQIEKTGWHGMESERGGMQEIHSTINSAFDRSYTYSSKNELIAYNMTPIEEQRLHGAYTKVMKGRREQDKVRFSTYEREILAQRPYLRKNEIGIVFNYENGVYKMMSDQEVSDIILNGLEEDMLWNFRTKRNVADKVACLISKIPLLTITDDKGYIVNVKNGLLNIMTRELQPHTPSFVSLIQFPAVYDPTATAPIWEECVKSWMEGPEQAEKTTLLKQFCGYCLSSSMLYDRALFIVGDGGNGKSTFVDTVAMVIGHEATSHIDLEGLYGVFGMHGLIGKRLNIIEEVHGNYYQSNKLKKLISGEQVTIDIKYKPQFTFRPQAKFIFSVNMFPRVDDTSTATERRICALTFLNNYRKNPNFKLRSGVGLLAQELPGILNWMIAGANDLAEKGNFIITREQTRMLEEYRQENSSVEGFLAQCTISEPGGVMTSTDLYNEYKKWSISDGGRKVKANITFTKEVKAFGEKDNRFTFSERENSGRESTFIGIKLSPQWVARNKIWQSPYNR
jgi:P4 family phage/plasmid primase-like protien